MMPVATKLTWSIRTSLTSLLLMLCAMTTPGAASSWTEQGDAGEFIGTAGASDDSGALSRIDGSLIDLGGNVDDIDMYPHLRHRPGYFLGRDFSQSE